MSAIDRIDSVLLSQCLALHTVHRGICLYCTGQDDEEQKQEGDGGMVGWVLELLPVAPWCSPSTRVVMKRRQGKGGFISAALTGPQRAVRWPGLPVRENREDALQLSRDHMFTNTLSQLLT